MPNTEVWDTVESSWREGLALGREAVVGALVVRPDGRVFAQRRSPDRRTFPNCWDLVGGHVEPGETPREALARELQEETGWELDAVLGLLKVVDWESPGATGPVHKREFVLAITVKADWDTPKLEADKVTEGRWFSSAEREILRQNRGSDTYVYDLFCQHWDTPRVLTRNDLDAIDILQPHDWPPYRAAFERYMELACVTPYGIGGEGLSVMGTLIQFGNSAWIAQVITHAEQRGRGWGKTIMRFLLEEAERRGIGTLSLMATELGYPIYDKLGFRVEGWYGFWTREDPAPPVPEEDAELEPWDNEHADALLGLDRWMSGEDRRAYFEGRLEGFRVGAEGFYLPRIGEGLVVARTETAGAKLLHRRLDGAKRVVIPVENEAAQRVAASRGFKEASRQRRMIRGPSLDRHPEALWSRIAGNLG